VFNHALKTAPLSLGSRHPPLSCHPSLFLPNPGYNLPRVLRSSSRLCHRIPLAVLNSSQAADCAELGSLEPWTVTVVAIEALVTLSTPASNIVSQAALAEWYEARKRGVATTEGVEEVPIDSPPWGGVKGGATV
jgi:hypothetical protein